MHINSPPLIMSTDTEYTSLQRAAEARLAQARAPGTWANHRAAVATYTRHCERYGVHELRPTPHQIRCWMEEIAARQCPSSVANSISHLRLHLRLEGAPVTPLDDIRVRLALDAIKRSKTHVPAPSVDVPIAIIKKVVDYLQATPQGRTVATAILFMYYMGARQSELAPHSAKGFDHTRHTTREDARIVDGALHLHQKWAKNLQANTQSRTRIMAPSCMSKYCPVAAYRAMLGEAPTTRANQPLLVFPADGATMAIPYIVKTWKAALLATGTAQRYTLHGIRKTAATVAFASGRSELEVQRFGGWASQAHRVYINTRDTAKVNETLITAFDKKQ